MALEELFKRQRAVKGVCAKTEVEPAEQWISRMSHTAEEKVRSLQKVEPNSPDKDHSRELEAKTWLDSPEISAEARLLRFDQSAAEKFSGTRKPSGASVQWSAVPKATDLFPVVRWEGESAGESEETDFICRFPEVNTQENWKRRIKNLEVLPKTVHWPRQCELMCNNAGGQIRELADHFMGHIRQGRKILSFCGDRSGRGCTTILLCCAGELARCGVKTLLIDGNTLHPTLSEMVSPRPEIGWESFFHEDHGEENDPVSLLAIRNNLDFLPLGLDERKIFGFFQNFRIESDWTSVFRDSYDIVLIDNGSLSERERCAEVERFGTDGVFLVGGGSERDRNRVGEIRGQLQRCGIPSIGIAENNSD